MDYTTAKNGDRHILVSDRIPLIPNILGQTRGYTYGFDLLYILSLNSVPILAAFTGVCLNTPRAVEI